MPAKAQPIASPVDEAVFPWLAQLLDVYHTTDQGAAASIAAETRKGRQLACTKGCSNGCRAHKTIPVYPLELVGLAWFVSEKFDGPTRLRLKQQLGEHAKGDACPMLVDGICSVHAMQLMACRQFNVFGQDCAEAEDAYCTRRMDVLTPKPKCAEQASFVMLPFYGVHDEAQRHEVIRNGSVHELAQTLQDCAWGAVADKMDDHERRHAVARDTAQ